MEYIKLKEIMDTSNTILIATHIDPDGDAVGSSLALYNYLKNINKHVDIIIKKAPQRFNYLNYFDEINIDETKLQNKYSTLIALDCGDDYRVAVDFEKIKFEQIVAIDHHLSHNKFADYTILNTKATATCELLYDVLTDLKCIFNTQIAECLYTGIITDSGCFKYSSVTSHTFDIASNLMNYGISCNKIVRNAIDIMSKEKFKLLQKAITQIEIIHEKIVYLYISKNDLKFEDNAHEGLVNYGREIEGIEVSIFIREIDVNSYMVSLRSNDYVNVSEIAKIFGGGGHLKAAGISYKGSLDKLKTDLINEIMKVI